MSGTPVTADINETGHVITATVTDVDGDTDSQEFTLRVGVDADTSPAFDPNDPGFPISFTGRVNDSFSEQLPSTTGGNLPITYTMTNVPPGLSFSGPIRVLTGTPSQAGTFLGLYNVTDVDGDSTGSINTRVVIEDDLMPTLPSIPDQTTVIGEFFSYTLPAAVGGDLPITYDLFGEPSWASVV